MKRDKSVNQPASGQPSSGRRRFLAGAGLAGAAGVTAAAAGAGAVRARTAEPAPRLDVLGGVGYHLSEHVRRYYRRALV